MPILVALSARATPPPVQAPDSCGPDFCVMVIGYSPVSSTTVTTRRGGSRIVLSLQDGTTIAFSSFSLIDRKDTRARVLAASARTHPAWIARSDRVALSTDCIGCGLDETVPPMVIAVALSTHPQRLPAYLDGAMVCVWAHRYAKQEGERLLLSDRRCIPSR
jgi:hypothetical protein